MRVALLISGYLRTFQENFDNLKSQILNKYDVVDVYLHFTKNGDKKDKYLNFNQDVDSLNKLLNPKCLLCEDNLDLSSLPEVNNTLNLWFKYFKLNEIKKENEEYVFRILHTQRLTCTYIIIILGSRKSTAKVIHRKSRPKSGGAFSDWGHLSSRSKKVKLDTYKVC